MDLIQMAHRLHSTLASHHRRHTARTSSRTLTDACQMCADQHLIPTPWPASSETMRPPQKAHQSTSMAWTKPTKAKGPTEGTTLVFKTVFILSKNSTQARQRKRRRSRKKRRRENTKSNKSTTTSIAIQSRDSELSTRRLRPNSLQ